MTIDMDNHVDFLWAAWAALAFHIFLVCLLEATMYVKAYKLRKNFDSNCVYVSLPELINKFAGFFRIYLELWKLPRSGFRRNSTGNPYISYIWV